MLTQNAGQSTRANRRANGQANEGAKKRAPEGARVITSNLLSGRAAIRLRRSGPCPAPGRPACPAAAGRPLPPHRVRVDVERVVRVLVVVDLDVAEVGQRALRQRVGVADSPLVRARVVALRRPRRRACRWPRQPLPSYAMPKNAYSWPGTEVAGQADAPEVALQVAGRRCRTRGVPTRRRRGRCRSCSRRRPKTPCRVRFAPRTLLFCSYAMPTWTGRCCRSRPCSTMPAFALPDGWRPSPDAYWTPPVKPAKFGES